MPTLYVENIPEALYEAMRARARAHRRSLASEVVAVLEVSFPTEQVLRFRRSLVQKLGRLRSPRRAPLRHPSSEEMQREDRGR